MSPYLRRRIQDRLFRGACALAALAAAVPLVLVVLFVAKKGVAALDLSFFTETPVPVGEPGGGMLHAILGTLIMVGLAALGAVPIGILTGVYLAESRAGDRFAALVRFATDTLAGMPSIVIGLLVYALVVVPMGHFSAMAGSIALLVVMLPVITRTTEELVRLVPDTLREAGLALGLPRWRVTLRIVVRTAASGLVTGAMLAVARASGETAPLLFTALGSDMLSTALDQPMASMPTQIYTYAVSPYEAWHAKAWGAALVLVGLVLMLNLLVRAVVRRPDRGR